MHEQFQETQYTASFSGFIRKSPFNRIRLFFGLRGVNAREDFFWASKGRRTLLVRPDKELLSNLPIWQQGSLNAELGQYNL